MVVGRRLVACFVGAATLSISCVAHAVSGPDVQVVAVDSSRYPVVAIDVAVPTHELSGTLPADAFSIAGASRLDVTRLDPAGIVVGLVLDDRSTVSASGVASEQGGAVELVRGLDPGTLLAVSSPSGVLVAASDDKSMQMRAIEAVGVHPLVASGALGRTLIDSAARLATTSSTRRVLVALVADGFAIGDAAADLRTALAGSRAQLHVVAVGSAVDPELAAVAAATGGTSTTTDARGVIAALDVVTRPLTGRYRLTANLDAPGTHVVRVTFGIATVQVNINVAAPAIPTTSSAPPTTVGARSRSTVAASVPRTVAGNAASSAAPTSRASVAPASSTAPQSLGAASHRGRRGLVVAVFGALVATVVAFATSLYRRWSRSRAHHTRRRTRRHPRTGPSTVAPDAGRSSGPGMPTWYHPRTPPTVTQPSQMEALYEERTDRTAEPTHALDVDRAARPRADDDAVGDEILQFAHLRAYPRRGEVVSAGRPVALTARELAVLALLMRSPERLVTLEDITAVWSTSSAPRPSTVVACVGSMRRKLEATGEPRLVHTIRGAGYLLHATDVVHEDEPECPLDQRVSTSERLDSRDPRPHEPRPVNETMGGPRRTR